MIRILAVGRIKAKFYREGCDEYLRRIGRFGNVEVVEVPDSDPAEEAKRLLAAHGPGPLVLCDPEGEAWTSHDVSRHLGAHGAGSFVIGGPDGLHPDLTAQASARVAFGRITLPHELARLVLLEQIYRGYTLLRGHPYHR